MTILLSILGIIAVAGIAAAFMVTVRDGYGRRSNRRSAQY